MPCAWWNKLAILCCLQSLLRLQSFEYFKTFKVSRVRCKVRSWRSRTLSRPTRKPVIFISPSIYSFIDIFYLTFVSSKSEKSFVKKLEFVKKVKGRTKKTLFKKKFLFENVFSLMKVRGFLFNKLRYCGLKFLLIKLYR